MRKKRQEGRAIGALRATSASMKRGAPNAVPGFISAPADRPWRSLRETGNRITQAQEVPPPEQV